MDLLSFLIGALAGLFIKVMLDKKSDKCPKCGGDLFWNSYDDEECPKCGYYRKG